MVTPKQPKFFWQGILILLPAFLLAGFGLWSLRQQRVLALHDARELAGKRSTQLTERLAKALRLEPANLPSTPKNGTMNFRSPAQDPASRVKTDKGAFIAFLDTSGKIVYPPAKVGLPLPSPVEALRLPPHAQELWRSLEEPAAASTDPIDPTGLWERARQSDLPKRHRDIATKRIASMAWTAGKRNFAIRLWTRLYRNGGESVGESGYPLRFHAALRLLDVKTGHSSLLTTTSFRQGQEPANRKGSPATEANDIPIETEELVNWLCGFAVLHPSSLTDITFQEVAKAVQGIQALEETVSRWREIKRHHKQTREIMTSVTSAIEAGTSPTNAAGWLEVSDKSYWIDPRSAADHDGPRHLIAWPEDRLQEIVDEATSSFPVPNYIGVNLTVSGREILESGNDGAELLADNLAARGAVQCTMTLARPDLLYKQERIQTYSFAGLLLFALIAVSGGFLSARRAFHRQRELSQMKSNFVSSVSHEMRAPVASVQLMSDELHSLELDDEEAIRDYHRLISKECGRLSALIENVLDFSRHEQGRKEYQFDWLDLNESIREAIEGMRIQAAEKQVTLETALTEEVVPIYADAPSLQRVLINLLDNAIKHSEEGASVTIGVEVHEKTVSFWVRDQGPGIPPEEHDKIFDQFYRRGSELVRQTPGVGLGLALTQKIVAAHHGVIQLDSAENQGACFTVRMNRAARKRESPDGQRWQST